MKSYKTVLSEQIVVNGNIRSENSNIDNNLISEKIIKDLEKMVFEYPNFNYDIKTLFFNIFDIKEQSFNYDIKKFLNLTIEDLKIQNLESLLFDDLKKITFSLSDDQKNQLKSYNELFGSSIEGISRTLSRVYVK